MNIEELIILFILRVELWHIIHYSGIRFKLRYDNTNREFLILIPPATVLTLVSEYDLFVFKVLYWFLATFWVIHNEV